MKEHNIFYVPPDFFKGKEVILPAARSQHIIKVLRKKREERITLTDGRGYRYDAELTDINRFEIRARIVCRKYVHAESSLNITLGFVPLKGSRNDIVIEKGTELGVARFIMFTSEHSVLKSIGAQKINRLQNIAQSAMTQSQRYYMPEVMMAPAISPLFKTGNYDRIIVADPHGDAEVPSEARKVLLLIGPEGGFSDSERNVFVSHGASLLKLGHTRLRSETAAIVGVTKILAAYGEL